MPVRTEDCKKAITSIVNSSDGGTILAKAYNGSPDIGAFLKHCWIIDRAGQQIPVTRIEHVTKQAGNPKNWKREEKLSVSSIGRMHKHPDEKGNMTLRVFDCRPFDDQLRAYVWDDGNQILKVEIQGE